MNNLIELNNNELNNVCGGGFIKSVFSSVGILALGYYVAKSEPCFSENSDMADIVACVLGPNGVIPKDIEGKYNVTKEVLVDFYDVIHEVVREYMQKRAKN